MDLNMLSQKLAELPTTLATFVAADDVLLKLVLSSVASLSAYGLYRLLRRIYRTCTSPLHALPGPPNESFLFGNLLRIRDADAAEVHLEWANQYGPAMQYKAFFSVSK